MRASGASEVRWKWAEEVSQSLFITMPCSVIEVPEVGDGAHSQADGAGSVEEEREKGESWKADLWT